MMIKTEKGFTLVETLFVFSAFLIIASVTIILIKPQFTFLDKQLFFSQLKSDLLFAQNYAISHQSEVTVNIIPEQNLYYARENFNGKFIITREFSERITIEEFTMKLFFRFQPDGNVNQFGSFYIFIGNEKYRVTFLIGKGRFYVAKE